MARSQMEIIKDGLLGEINRESAVLKFKMINLNTNTSVEFVATPDSIADAYSANFTEKNIVGRSAPLLVYTGGSAKTIDFAVLFHEDLVPGKDLYKFMDKIRAMQYPEYQGGIKPPRVYIKIGNMYSFWGVMNASITYSPPIRNQRYILASVAFSIKQVWLINPSKSESTILSDTPLSASDVEGV